jgi:hypothetical protein
MLRALFYRRDPWWDVERSAARRDRRRHRTVALMAFFASIAAVSGAMFAWAIHLGLASFAMHVG